MRKLTKMLAVIVCFVFLLTSMGQTILAAEQTTKVLQVHEDVRKAIEKELQANPDKVKADIEYSKKLSEKGYHTNFAAAVVATYFIPGIGEVALLATGAILVGGIAIAAGTWLWNKIQSWLANSDKEVDVSGRSGWTEKDSEGEVLNDVNGKKDGATKSGDGTIKIPVKDKDTNEDIGEIHLKQPERYWEGSKWNYTGKKYPPHYQDYKNRLGKGEDHHWWWH